MMPRHLLRALFVPGLCALIAVLGPLLAPKHGSSAASSGPSAGCPPGVCNDVEVIGQIGGSVVSTVVQGAYAYVGAGSRLLILNVADPGHPVLVGRTAVFPNVVQDVAVAGIYAYVATGASGLRVFDVSDPAKPVAMGEYNTPGSARSVAVAGSFAYVADRELGLRVIDVADPATPVEAGFYDTPGNARGVAVAGEQVYVADGLNGLRVFDVSNPSTPISVGVLDTPGEAMNVALVDGLAYVADYDSGLRIIDVTNTATPVSVGFYDTPELAMDVAIAGAHAYVADERSGMRVIDITNPAEPVEASFFSIPGHAYGVTSAGNYIYLSDFYFGLRVIDISSPEAPVQAGMHNVSGYGYGIATVGSYAYLTAGINGLRVIDVTDPASPVEVGADESLQEARNVVVAGTYAYVANGTSGLRVVDIADPADPVEVAFFDSPGEAEGLAIVGNRVFLADGSRGLRVIDVTNQLAPTELGFFDTPECAMAVVVVGIHAYVADAGAGLRIIDVKDPAAPVETGFYDTPGSALGLAVVGARAYVADAGAGLRVIDVTNPAAPIETGFYDTPGSAYDVTVAGGYAYVADRDSGLRVLSVATPSKPVLYGYYDTPGYARHLAVSGKRAYVADEYGGFTILDYLGLNPPTPTPTPTLTPTPTSTPTPTPTPDPAAADKFEPDNTCLSAGSIEPNTASQVRTFHQASDADWASFEARSGVHYVIEASVPYGSPADITMELYPGCEGLPVETQGEAFTPNIRIDFNAPADGPLYIKLVNQDPSVAGPQVAYEVNVTTPDETLPGALILVGGRLRKQDGAQANIHFVTDAVYHLFRDHGYGDDRITYLATDLGLPGADAMPTRGNLQAAITTWAADKVGPGRPLTIYLMDHGGVDRFYLDELHGERIVPSDLDAWLGDLELSHPGLKVNVIVEACHSGSFIAPLDGQVGKPGRVVISSTDVKNLAWASDDGATFSDGLVTLLGQGQNLETSFRRAAEAVGLAHPSQRPWLDADGDGLANQPTDFSVAAQRGFGVPGSFDPNWPPYIFAATGPSAITFDTGIISADVRDDVHVHRVWAVIYPPSYVPPVEGDALIDEVLPTIVLQPTQGSWHAALYTGFDQPGRYRIVVYAEDAEGSLARPLALDVMNGYSYFLPTVLH